MKLHDYRQMMAYMRRPGFQNGTMVPPQKPEQKTPFIDKLKNLKNVAPGLMPRSKVDILKMYMDEALKDGEITQEQHTEMLMPYFGELGEKVTEQIEVSDRDNFANGTNLTNLEKKQNLYNKALKELPEGYLEDYKNIFLKDRGDGTFSRKSGEEGGFDIIKEKYEDQIKDMKTRQGPTKNINEKIKVFNNAILQNLKKENKIVSGLKDKDLKRTQYVRDAQGRDIKYKAPKGYQAHHMLPLGSRIGMTNQDIAIISKEMNAALSEYDKPMNKLVQDSMKLNFNEEGSLKKLDEINKKLASYVEKAEKELPKKYKGLIGFNKLTPVLDTFDDKGEQVFGIEKIGTDYKKSIGATQPEKLLKDIPTKELQKLTANAPKLKAALLPGLEELVEGIKNIPDDIAKKRYFKLGLKALGPLGTYIAVDDTYEALKEGKPVAEALEYGLIGTDIIGSTKDLMALSPEGREARSVVKQGEMREQITDDFSSLDTDFDTPNVKSDMSRQEAERKWENEKVAIGRKRAAEEKAIANARAVSIEGLKNLITGQRFAGQQIPEQFLAVGGRVGYADGPDDPSKRKFIKLGAGLMSLPIIGKYLKFAAPVAEKTTEIIRRGADGIPDFILDLIAKVKLKAEEKGMKYFTGNRSDEFADVYQADDFVVTEQGNKITLKKRKQEGDMLEKDIEMEIETDPETGGMTYKEATARPDAEGKLKDVEEYIDEIDLEDMKKYTYDE